MVKLIKFNLSHINMENSKEKLYHTDSREWNEVQEKADKGSTKFLYKIGIPILLVLFGLYSYNKYGRLDLAIGSVLGGVTGLFVASFLIDPTWGFIKKIIKQIW